MTPANPWFQGRGRYFQSKGPHPSWTTSKEVPSFIDFQDYHLCGGVHLFQHNIIPFCTQLIFSFVILQPPI